MSDWTFEPLRVEARLTEPVVYSGDGMHLDGILAMAAYRDLPEVERRALPDIRNAEWPVDFDLPLARWTCPVPKNSPNIDPRLLDDAGMLWGWRASAVQARWIHRTTHELRKRPAIAQMVGLTQARRANIAIGPGKARNLRFEARQPADWRLTWHVLGDRDEILRLLRAHIWGVGKFCAHGMGRVREWSIDADDRDISVIDHRVDPPRLMRRVPVSIVASPRFAGPATLAESGIRPPYHHPTRYARTLEPEDAMEDEAWR